MNYLDIVFCAVLLLLTFISARRGLLNVLSQYLASIAAYILAKLLCEPASSFVYSHYVAEQVQSKLAELLPDGSVSGQIDGLADTVVASLPALAQKVVSQFRLTELLHTGASEASVLTVSEIETLYVAPIVTKALSIVVMFVLFVVLAVLLKTAVHFLHRALFEDRESKFQGVNKFLGALLGVARGLLAVFVLAFLLNLAASFLTETPFQSAVASSYVCNYVSTLL